MDEFLRFGLPPLLGALIGYVTNALAIRMLFRPLKEIRVFGIRLPFTPGVIPRRRGSLAESIGRMVSQRLLTKEAVLAKVDSPEFHAGLSGSVSRFTSELLERPLTAEQSPLSRDVTRVLTGFLSSFLRSPAAVEVVRTVISEAVRGVADLRWKDILDKPDRVVGMVTELKIWRQDHLERTIRDLLVRHREAGTTLEGIVTDPVMQGLRELLLRLYGPIVARIMLWLRSEDVRTELIVRGRVILERILGRLNVFQRLIVTAAQYERSLRERMPGIIDDLLDTLERTLTDARNRQRIVDAVTDGLASLRGRPVAELLAQEGEQAEDTAGRLSLFVHEFLVRHSIPEGLGELGARFVAGNSESRIEETARSLSGLSPQEIADRLVSLVGDWLESGRGAELIAGKVVDLAGRFLSNLSVRPLGEVVRVDEAMKERLDAFVTRQLSAILVRKTPELVAALDVQRLVEDKINALDVENVEKLLLMVIASHLKWINVFGAFIGALVGGIQVLIGILTT